METTHTNKEFNPAAANNKKTWAEPTLLVIGRGYVEGGLIASIHESNFTQTPHTPNMSHGALS